MAEIATQPHQQVTVVLQGQAQADYRARVQHYYRQVGVACLAAAPLPANSAGEAYREQLRQLLEQVTTPLVVLATDSDFVLEPALHGAAARLHEQPQVVAAQGHALGFAVGNAQVMYHKLGAVVPALVGADARARLRQYGQSGLQAWRAVIRVPALQAALALMPAGSDFAAFRLGLSYAILAQGEIAQLDQTDVLCAYQPAASSQVVRDEQLNQALRSLRQWDAEHLALCVGDSGFAVLNRFVRDTYDQGVAPLLFTSTWGSVLDDPERLFEPRQYIDKPYYTSPLFAQLTALEFLCHAWPAGVAQHQALEGGWVRTRDLLRVHPNDTGQTLQLRYWQALALGLFDPQVCQRLLDTLTGAEDGDRARELKDWLKRLEQVPGIEQLPRLGNTVSGQVLAALDAATPDDAARQQVLKHLAARQAGQIAFVVLDLGNDDQALQATFDSLLASGIRDFKLVVLKAGKPPAITTARDTLHFIQVNDSNWLAHLNQAVRQLPSEWLMLLQAGDELLAGGLLHLQVELAESPACQAICANEVQRDDQGCLHAVERPGADINVLRSQPGLMAQHWLVRRQAVLDLGGYSEAHRRVLEFDLLLRLVETQGLGCLAYLDDYLVIGAQTPQALTEEAMKALNRHLTQLGYRAQLRDQQDAGIAIDYRHSATPLVSILLASNGDQAQLEACLTSVLQRTRYPRYEVLVVCAEHELEALQHLGGRVQLLVGEPGGRRSAWLNQAAELARGEYLVLLSANGQVVTPAWIEALLNEAQRPEVGVVGGVLRAADGALMHAGYALLEGPQVVAPWQGLSAQACAQVRWPLVVHSCPAVSGDCLMVRQEVFAHCGRLQSTEGADIDLCLAAAHAGQLVVCTPQAQLQTTQAQALDSSLAQALQARWPAAFVGKDSEASAQAWLAQVR
ncbi:Glycosyl transferase family 2 [compost metagenome]